MPYIQKCSFFMELYFNLASYQFFNIFYIVMWGSGFGQGGFGGGFGGYGGFGGHHHGHHHHHHHGGFMSFNRWGNTGYNYSSMPGFVVVDYSSGWNGAYHDQLLRNNIDIVYQRYDYNYSGQLEGNEFYYAYRDLCLLMGLAPPNDYHSVWNAMMACDTNRDGRISKMEMFMLFKRIQGINAGYGF